MSSIIWTRGLDDWDYDKGVLASLDLDVLHFPCIELTPVPVKFPKQKPQIFVFTSANAVRYAGHHPALMNLVKSSEGVYAIGLSTQAALTAAKIHSEIPAEVQSAEHIAVWLSRNLSPHTIVAIPSAKEPSFDFKDFLERYAIHVDILPVYQTHRMLRLPNGKSPDAATVERYIQTLDGVVCFASPSAVEGFANTLMAHKNRLYDALTAVAIGGTTEKAAVRYFSHVVVSPEQSILGLAEKARSIVD